MGYMKSVFDENGIEDDEDDDIPIYSKTLHFGFYHMITF